MRADEASLWEELSNDEDDDEAAGGGGGGASSAPSSSSSSSSSGVDADDDARVMLEMVELALINPRLAKRHQPFGLEEVGR